MPVLEQSIEYSISSVSPETELLEIINLMGQRTAAEASQDKVAIANNCVYVTENSQLLGVFTLQDLVRLIASGINLASVTIGEVMRQPVATVGLSNTFDNQTVFSLMQQHNTHELPVLDELGKILGIISIADVFSKLQAELAKLNSHLQREISQRCSLELALIKSEENLEDLRKANKQLQRGICDRIATEAQLLQTTSELQELFQAFPDVYFRLRDDGTILSYHARDAFDFYLPPEEFLGRPIQDIMPSDVACQLQQAILGVHETNSLVAVEYELQTPAGTKSYEARLLPSMANQIVAIVRDITERKQAQAALQRAKSELEIRVQERTSELKNSNERLLQEIIERKRIESALRYRAEFEKLITTISTHFINLATNEIDNGINEALKTISEFTNVDRSYVFLFSDNSASIENTYEWCAKGIENYDQDLTQYSLAQQPWILDKLRRFETIYIPAINDTKALNTASRQVLIEQNIQSLIILPIVCSGLLIGYLGFDSVRSTKTWSEDSIALLKMVGEILGNALERKRVEQALRISEERYVRAISAGKVGIWEWNTQTNEIYLDSNLKAMLGYKDSEISNHFDDWLKLVHPDDVEWVTVEAKAYLEGLIPKYEIEHRMQHKDGSYIWFLARGNVVRDAEGKPCCIAGSNTDITARKQAENQLKASLKEKEVLLKEIHHRVKNNLQVISSLLRLQAGYIKNEQTLEIFRDSQNRVRAMALIHENLYKSDDLARIDFSDYIRKLTNNLLRSYGVNRNIRIHLDINKAFLRIDTAIPCGLIINELVSNSLKHAFPETGTGDIHVAFLDIGNCQYSLSVTDNGIGVPEDIELHLNQSLGLQLVWNLVEQLEGSIACNRNLGTSFTIKFVESN